MCKFIRSKLVEFYIQQDIHPEQFNCTHQVYCRQFAYQQKMTAAKMSMVGSQYGIDYPKIVVVSLDPPLGEKGVFSDPTHRTTEYVSETHEGEDYSFHHPNSHWARTNIIVSDILYVFGFFVQPGVATVDQGYEGRPIENVTAYFAHANVAKCSMNNPDKGGASVKVHKKCSKSYLLSELEILQPEILITQGKITNIIMGEMMINRSINLRELPFSMVIEFGDNQVLWLPMHHPSRHIKAIQKYWSSYKNDVRMWSLANIKR
jgi:hypothetical protein